LDLRRWPVWLLAGVVTACALIALSIAAESLWLAGHPRLADLVSVSRLALCWLWLRPAWRALQGPWSHAGRAALAAVLVFAVLT
jgi:hypothetical protein